MAISQPSNEEPLQVPDPDQGFLNPAFHKESIMQPVHPAKPSQDRTQGLPEIARTKRHGEEMSPPATLQKVCCLDEHGMRFPVQPCYVVEDNPEEGPNAPSSPEEVPSPPHHRRAGRGRSILEPEFDDGQKIHQRTSSEKTTFSPPRRRINPIGRPRLWSVSDPLHKHRRGRGPST
jgi:hypothetical protein